MDILFDMVKCIITQFALDEVIWLVPSHPPPYVMFSSLLTWWSHRRSGIPSYPLVAAGLSEDVNSCFVHRCSHAHFLLVQRGASTNSWNQENVNERLSPGPKCRIKSPPHTLARSSLLTALYVQLQTMWSRDHAVQGQCHVCSLSYNKCPSLGQDEVPVLETGQREVVLVRHPALV